MGSGRVGPLGWVDGALLCEVGWMGWMGRGLLPGERASQRKGAKETAQGVYCRSGLAFSAPFSFRPKIVGLNPDAPLRYAFRFHFAVLSRLFGVAFKNAKNAQSLTVICRDMVK